MDGLLDDRARFQVEYTKQPATIDDAVYEVVNFMETKNRLSGEKARRQARAVRHQGDDSVCSSDDDDHDDCPSPRAARVQPKLKPQAPENQSKNQHSLKQNEKQQQTDKVENQGWKQHIELLEKRIKELEGRRKDDKSQYRPKYQSTHQETACMLWMWGTRSH